MSNSQPSEAAKNLLFGLLAFQNNFINRRALLAAFDAWTVAESLGDAAEAGEAENEAAQIRKSDSEVVPLDARLTAYISGNYHPKSGIERIALAQQAVKRASFVTATRLWSEAMEADPTLADDREINARYNAAISAALAGTGWASERPRLDQAAMEKLRSQALRWLKYELSVLEKVATSVEPGKKELVARTLKRWKGDDSLSRAVEKLPASEREAWQALWAEVDLLHSKVGKP